MLWISRQVLDEGYCMQLYLGLHRDNLGIAMLVNECATNFIYIGVNRQIVAVKITGHNGLCWLFGGVYASTREGEREELWLAVNSL